MVKRLSGSSARRALTKRSTEDIASRHWTKAEKQAIRRASQSRAVGLDLPEKEFKDIPGLTGAQLAELVRPRKARPKVAISVRLDPQVLDWLRAQGDGHLTRINDILSNLMEAESQAGAGK